MPQIFDAATISRFAQQAEDNFLDDHDCIVERYAIGATVGVPLYVLPDYVKMIRRLTWKGQTIYPMSHRRFRDNAYSVTSQGRPTEYIYNNVGQNTIKLFPAPNENVAALQTNLFTSEIPNRVIVEYYRTSDYTINTLPDFFKRRLIKAFVMKMCFSIEGKGQNLKAAKYWSAKYEFLKELYGNLLDDLINTPRKLLANDYSYSFGVPGRPHLPISRFGVGVDAGE